MAVSNISTAESAAAWSSLSACGVVGIENGSALRPSRSYAKTKEKPQSNSERTYVDQLEHLLHKGMVGVDF